jgi:hypothetical protein
MKLIITEQTAQITYLVPFEGKCKQFVTVIDLQRLKKEEASELIKAKIKDGLIDMIRKFLKHRLECYRHVTYCEKVALVNQYMLRVDLAKHKPLSYLFNFILDNDWTEIMPRKENKWNAIIRLMRQFTKKINNQIYN